MSMTPGGIAPTDILLIKSHSMGIGDLLRSSAAWSALKTRWPDARLHLLMLSKQSGYATEAFIRSHHLLASAHFVTVKTGDPNRGRQHSLPRAQVWAEVAQRLKDQPIDLIIDCESGGMKTALLTWWLGRLKGAPRVGIAQFPLRRLCYDLAAPSVPRYAVRLGLTRPLDYTERDFVALAALGIARDGTRITLKSAAAGQAWRQDHPLLAGAGQRIVVLNIGCGTEDAIPKRPALPALVACLVALYAQQPFALHLSGADFEREVNLAFMGLFSTAMAQQGWQAEVVDWAGQLTLDELTGLLGQADLVVSSDSGPYHMAVALGLPTLCWFNFDTPPSYHPQPGVSALVLPGPEAFVTSALGLLAAGRQA
ncbi:MAG: glycosyltransferase family 9 protein [Betaproteobacteria bacterium]